MAVLKRGIERAVAGVGERGGDRDAIERHTGY